MNLLILYFFTWRNRLWKTANLWFPLTFWESCSINLKLVRLCKTSSNVYWLRKVFVILNNQLCVLFRNIRSARLSSLTQFASWVNIFFCYANFFISATVEWTIEFITLNLIWKLCMSMVYLYSMCLDQKIGFWNIV